MSTSYSRSRKLIVPMTAHAAAMFSASRLKHPLTKLDLRIGSRWVRSTVQHA